MAKKPLGHLAAAGVSCAEKQNPGSWRVGHERRFRSEYSKGWRRQWLRSDRIMEWPRSFGQRTWPSEFCGSFPVGPAGPDRWNSLCSLVILLGRCRSDRGSRWAWLCNCPLRLFTDTNRIGPTRLDELRTGTVVAISADNDERCGAAGWPVAACRRGGLTGRNRKGPGFCGNDAIRTPARWLVR